MKRTPLLSLPDYQRIFQVAYSVLEASEIAITHRACLFFSSVGMLLLRKDYKLPATISVGCMALMVDEEKDSVVVYGREEEDKFVCDENGFHAWVECNGWMIDFMAPIMGVAFREDGGNIKVPRRMLQKRLSDQKASLSELQRVGDFFVVHDISLAEIVLNNQQSNQFEDLKNICLEWFRRPPKALRKDIMMGDSYVATPKPLTTARVPSIDGVW
ncbi:DUF2026 family protein [Azohydromonas lata]|uniref:DUF2026 family protein n=1 Tax=Azohydromonas lata TaxID=45677 RepID=A0ABU5IK46_9BURK|nr:DUF2026 family protein [Azohydromonas lata]MDZ5459275.1 DUF2026 family protein [Azohydromonas lata]